MLVYIDYPHPKSQVPTMPLQIVGGFKGFSFIPASQCAPRLLSSYKGFPHIITYSTLCIPPFWLVSDGKLMKVDAELSSRITAGVLGGEKLKSLNPQMAGICIELLPHRLVIDSQSKEMFTMSV